MKHWIDGVASLYLVVLVDSFIDLLYFLYSDGGVNIVVRPFEVDFWEEALMVAESAWTKCDLLDLIWDNHVKDALGSGLYVIVEEDLFGHVPHLQVISSSCKQKVLLMEYHWGNGHCFWFGAAQKVKVIEIVYSSQSVHASNSQIPLRAIQGQNWRL